MKSEYNNTIDNKTAFKSYKGLMKAADKVITKRYKKDFSNQINHIAREEFEKLIPEIPYTGGKKNFFSDLQIKAAVILALYRALKNKGITLEDYSSILEDLTYTYMNSFPSLARKLMGKLWMGKLFQKIMIKHAKISQKRKYKDDFVFEVVSGNEEFKWGINYIECGITKFYSKQNERELAKLACVLDYLMFPAIGVKLERKGTIANGCELCDFRFN